MTSNEQVDFIIKLYGFWNGHGTTKVFFFHQTIRDVSFSCKIHFMYLFLNLFGSYLDKAIKNMLRTMCKFSCEPENDVISLRQTRNSDSVTLSVQADIISFWLKGFEEERILMRTFGGNSKICEKKVDRWLFQKNSSWIIVYDYFCEDVTGWKILNNKFCILKHVITYSHLKILRHCTSFHLWKACKRHFLIKFPMGDCCCHW